MGGHKERMATIARATGKRSVRQRCPNCKKLRKRWFRGNHYDPGYTKWHRIEVGKSKVCHVCVKTFITNGGILPTKVIKTITFSDLRKLERQCKTTGTYNIRGRSMHYVGFGWLDEGPATPTDTLVTDEDGKALK